VKQGHPQHAFAINLKPACSDFICQHHGSDANTERMCGHRLCAIGEATERPTRPFQAFQTLKLNQCGKHFITLTRSVVPTKRTMPGSTAKENGDTISRVAVHSKLTGLFIDLW
jgi:hypothetical protein